MRTDRRFFTLLGSGLATAVVISFLIWKRKRDNADDVFIDDIELFTTLRRIRSCKDNTSYNDVVCRRLRKRLRFTPTPGNRSSPSSVGEPANDTDNEVTRRYSDTSLSTYDRRSVGSSGSNDSLSGGSSSSRSPNSGPLCQLSATILGGTATDAQHRHQATSSNASIHIHDNTSFQDALCSPIVEEHTDSRVKVRRASLEPATSIVQLYNRARTTSSPDMTVHAIYDTYSNIVQPLHPNTGQTISKTFASK